LIAKKTELEKIKSTDSVTERIIRVDKYGNSFYYYLKDETVHDINEKGSLKTLTDIFDACKRRSPKERTASIASIPPLKY
jgi:hypothetical protein